MYGLKNFKVELINKDEVKDFVKDPIIIKSKK